MQSKRIRESLLDEVLSWINARNGEEFTVRQIIDAGLVGSVKHCCDVVNTLIYRKTGVVKIGTVGKKVRYAMREDAKRITWDDVWKMMDNS